jgi:hypothetical protein
MMKKIILVLLMIGISVVYNYGKSDFSKDCEDKFGQVISSNGNEFCLRPDIK